VDRGGGREVACSRLELLDLEDGRTAMAIVRVGTFGSRAEAELARGMLDTHGIRTRVADTPDPIYGTRTVLGGGPSLLVDEEDAAEARRLLDEVHAAPTDAAETDPYRSPFEEGSRLPRQRRARRILVGAIGLYGIVRVLEFVLTYE
jgi:hypothetical protein